MLMCGVLSANVNNIPEQEKWKDGRVSWMPSPSGRQQCEGRLTRQSSGFVCRQASEEDGVEPLGGRDCLSECSLGAFSCVEHVLSCREPEKERRLRVGRPRRERLCKVLHLQSVVWTGCCPSDGVAFRCGCPQSSADGRDESGGPAEGHERSELGSQRGPHDDSPQSSRLAEGALGERGGREGALLRRWEHTRQQGREEGARSARPFELVHLLVRRPTTLRPDPRAL